MVSAKKPAGGPAPAMAAAPTSPAPAASAKPTATATKCDPPYYFDAKGNRLYKPECL
jgi:hypothetical protein